MRRTLTPLPAQSLHSQDFSSQGAGWTSAWSGGGSVTWNHNPTDGTSHTTTVKLTGNGTDWTTQTYRDGTVSDTQQARVAFKVSQTGSGAVVALESSDAANYIGLYEEAGAFKLRRRYGGSFLDPVTLMPGVQPNGWYVLDVAVDDAAGMRVSVWPEGQAGMRYEARWEMPRGLGWRFHAWTKQGSLYLDGALTDGAYKEERPSGTSSATRIVGKHYEVDTTSGQVTKRYYAGGVLLATKTGTTLTYVQGDHLGSTSTLTNGGGNVVGRERYSAFGERRRSDSAAITDQLYTGQRLNVLSGLYHYSDGTSAGRFYDPLLARFVQADSVTPGTTSIALNRYAYANNSPVVFSDPSGHAAWKDEYEGDYGSPAQGFVPYAQDYNEWYYGTWEQAHGSYQGVDSDPYLNNPSYANEGYPSADGLANSVSAVASRRANQRVLDEAAIGRVSKETIQAAAVEAGPGFIMAGVAIGQAKSQEGITRRAAFRQAKRDLGIPMTQQPDEVGSSPLTGRDGKAVLDEGGQPIGTREYVYTRADGTRVVIQEHSAGHLYGEGGVGDVGPHFNVRPIGDLRHGTVPGTLSHYLFER